MANFRNVVEIPASVTELFPRKCSVCGCGMVCGYYDGDYYCSDSCLHTVYTDDEWAAAYDEDSDECYYTDWLDMPDEELVYPELPAADEVHGEIRDLQQMLTQALSEAYPCEVKIDWDKHCLRLGILYNTLDRVFAATR